MTSTSVRPSGYKQPARDPSTAAMLSIIPGLGQLYNGETRKGFLFLAVAAMNASLFVGMIFVDQILAAFRNFADGFHMKPNIMLIKCLHEANFGSSVSIIMLGLFVSFIAYAVRDAYDHAALKRRKIYPDMVIELPEATSGSYMFHFSFMVALFILAFFFLIPPPNPSQITDIEFIENQPPVHHKVVAPRKAEHNSVDAGKHQNKPVTAHSPAPKAPAPAQNPTPKPPAPHHSEAPKPTPAPTPMPHPAPTPHPTAHPSPSPSPAPSPHPSPSPSPSPMPRLAPSPVPMPSALPTPHAMPHAAPSPMPTLAPAPMAHSAGLSAPSPMPTARPAGGNFAGLPSAAPSPISMSHGGGGAIGAGLPKIASSNTGGGFFAPAPVAVGGGSGGGGGSGPAAPAPVAAGGGSRHGGGGGGGASGAPAPIRARSGGGGGGGGGGPEIVVTPSVPRGGGGGGGSGQQGNPGANNRNGNSTAASADIDFGPYMADLQRRIKKHWFPPKGNESKRVVVVFKVHTGGELSDLRIDHSSGVAIADNAALNAVQDAAPFKPLPAGAPDSVDIQFTFDYNVFNGQGRGVFRQF